MNKKSLLLFFLCFCTSAFICRFSFSDILSSLCTCSLFILHRGFRFFCKIGQTSSEHSPILPVEYSSYSLIIASYQDNHIQVLTYGVQQPTSSRESRNRLRMQSEQHRADSTYPYLYMLEPVLDYGLGFRILIFRRKLVMDTSCWRHVVFSRIDAINDVPGIV